MRVSNDWIFNFGWTVPLTLAQLLKEKTSQRLHRRNYVCTRHSTYHMVEYTAIFSSHSAAMHEELKQLHHISCLFQSSVVTHWEKVNSTKNSGSGPVMAGLVESVRGLAEGWTHADGAVQSSSGHVAKECQLTEFGAGCLLWKALRVGGINRTWPFWSYRGVCSVNLKVTWVHSVPFGWLVFHSLPESFPETQNNDSHIKTGCKHAAKQDLVQINANFSRRTNAGAL